MNLHLNLWRLALDAVGEATILLLIIPNPDKLASILTLDTPPRSYVIVYSLVRYIANLNINAAWQAKKDQRPEGGE